MAKNALSYPWDTPGLGGHLQRDEPRESTVLPLHGLRVLPCLETGTFISLRLPCGYSDEFEFEFDATTLASSCPFVRVE